MPRPTTLITHLKLTAMTCMFIMHIASTKASADVPPIRGLQEVNHHQVELQGGFWGLRQDTHHKVTVPHALDCLEKAGHMTNFDKAAGKFDGPLRDRDTAM